MGNHMGEKPHKCNQCNYNSVSAGQLQIHMRMHTGEKPNKCNHCNFKCVTASHRSSAAPHEDARRGETFQVQRLQQSLHR